VATFPEHGDQKQTLIDLADQCLYFAKRHGRNQSVTVDKLQSQKTG
jgi:GGDEF domain-containing protein